MMIMMICIYCNWVNLYKNRKIAKNQPKGETIHKTIHKTIQKHRILKTEKKNTKQKHKKNIVKHKSSNK
jgi:hypothetical protein